MTTRPPDHHPDPQPRSRRDHRRTSRRVPRIVPLAVGLAAVVALTGVGAQVITSRQDAVRPVAGRPAAPATATTPATTPDAEGTPTTTVSPSPTATTTPTATPTTTPTTTPSAPTTPAAGLTDDDVLAGLLSTQFSTEGSGSLVTVPGSQKAPGSGRTVTFRVQVEKGLPVDGRKFAEFAFGVLNDRRGWGAGGTRRFARTDGDSDFRLVLASPETSAKMCRPLDTGGTLSCRNGDDVVLTIYRWVKGTPDYGDNRLDYRRYLVSHEVGHFLGNGHVRCPAPGRKAPVMMQQTKGLDGCAQNPWPNP